MPLAFAKVDLSRIVFQTTAKAFAKDNCSRIVASNYRRAVCNSLRLCSHFQVRQLVGLRGERVYIVVCPFLREGASVACEGPPFGCVLLRKWRRGLGAVLRALLLRPCARAPSLLRIAPAPVRLCSAAGRFRVPPFRLLLGGSFLF